MNEMATIPWGKVFSNFIWILGAAVILAAFSYHEFLAYTEKAKRIEVFKRDSFKKSLLLGAILIAAGISASAHKLWLTLIFGIAALLLIILAIKIIKIQATAKKDRD
jgi:tellurite resistance protein TehA-like permease